MRKIDNFEQVEEVKQLPRVEEGPYVAKIVKVEDFEDRQYLRIEFDIEQGDAKGSFKSLSDNIGQWPAQGVLYRSYKQNALPYFKRFIVAVEKSNSDYKFNFDEQTLVNKLFVANFGIEEYDNGTEIKESLKVQEARSIQSLKDGKIQTPKAKRLSQSEHDKYKSTQSMPEIPDSDLPF